MAAKNSRPTDYHQPKPSVLRLTSMGNQDQSPLETSPSMSCLPHPHSSQPQVPFPSRQDSHVLSPIHRPPTPLTPSSSLTTPEYPLTSAYAAFDRGSCVSSLSPWEWHDSIWRGSTPCLMVCAACHTRQPNVSTQSCGHMICQACLAQSLVLHSRDTYASSCTVCDATTADQGHKDWSSLRSPLSQPGLPGMMLSPPHFPVAKLSNIPWDVSQQDIRNFFSRCRLPSLSVYPQAIHIMMDRTTGKTLSDAYVEFATPDDLQRAMDTRHQKPLKGRIVTVTECLQEELLTVVFPKWRGRFCGVSAIPPASEVIKTMSTAAGGGSTACPPFITREEINSLLVVCKNYKLHFSRKCAERPFENIISVITKYPWHQTHLISTMHRDHIYEMLKLSIESLRMHLSKDYVQIDPSLLERLVRAGIMCSAFTERQKTMLLQTARIECPADLTHFMYSTTAVPSAVSPPQNGISSYGSHGDYGRYNNMATTHSSQQKMRFYSVANTMSYEAPQMLDPPSLRTKRSLGNLDDNLAALLQKCMVKPLKEVNEYPVEHDQDDAQFLLPCFLQSDLSLSCLDYSSSSSSSAPSDDASSNTLDFLQPAAVNIRHPTATEACDQTLTV